MAYSLIKLELNSSIYELTLNNPQKRNPLSFEMITELTAALQEVERSEAFGLILGAAGPTFCAGHDFKDMLERDLGGMRELMHACSHLMQLIHHLPQPVVAKVQGAAMGAGCQLALSCDFVVASEDASFRTPGGGGGWFCITPMVALTRTIGRKRALEMLMTGEPISAQLASEWGMINRLVPAKELDESTKEFMARITQGSPLLKGIGKHAFYTQIELDEARAYQYATELMASTGMMPHPQERMRAFLEKRKPVFE